jgi:quinoprotein glucose dehydrogenase
VFGLPLFKPPWGRITAFDLNSGERIWMIPNGETPAAVKNNPALKGIDTSNFGSAERAPLLVTKTLLFAASGRRDPRLRALDKRTGSVVFQMDLPGNASGGPMTYMVNGRQFIVISVVVDPGSEPELAALAIPNNAEPPPDQK